MTRLKQDQESRSQHGSAPHTESVRDSEGKSLTFRFLLVMMTSPVRLVVSPCAEGKLRRGGGGGGDLEGFSVRYRATFRSTVRRDKCVSDVSVTLVFNRAYAETLTRPSM